MSRLLQPFAASALAYATDAWRRCTGRRYAGWEEIARTLGGVFERRQKAVAYAFGRAPWQAMMGPESPCALLVQAARHAPPFWIVDTQLPERHSQWLDDQQPIFGVTVAVVRVGPHPGPKLLPVAVGPNHTAFTNGGFLFLWEEAAGRRTGKKQKLRDLAAFLRHALAAAAPLQALHAATAAAPAASRPAGLEPGGTRTA